MKTLCALLLMASAALAGVSPGDQAPDFRLEDTEGHQHHLHGYLSAGKTVVLEWFNPDCPFVKKHHLEHKTMSDLASTEGELDVVWLAINSGAEGKQGAGLERNQKARVEFGMTYPVLLDGNGKVGKRWGATNTPHMFVIASDGTVVYAGAIDDNSDARKLGEVNHVAAALADLEAGRDVQVPATKAYGCSVKY
jgi:peroxiredoxin